ncbi:MAG: ribonuclease HII [Nanoarchaeota archaeon]
MEEYLLGIDDAGRGPVIGPMVLAGCLIEKSDEESLKSLGVKDSKLLTATRREKILEEIKKISKNYEYEVLTAKEISDMMSEGINLNFIEAIAAAKIINKTRKKYLDLEFTVVLDCPSINTNSWLIKVKELVGNTKGMKFICEHKADANYVSVSAGSIIAKVTRDAEIEKIKKEIKEDFGSGYPSDPKTVQFIKKHYEEYKHLGIFREHWQTLKNILGIDTKKIAVEQKKKESSPSGDKQKKLF